MVKLISLFFVFSISYSAIFSQDLSDRIKFKGDLRYRYEYIDDDDKSDERHRNRIRARLQVDGKVNDQIKVVLRLATGSSDPVSTNQTIDTGFSKKAINLDLAYFNYRPDFLENLSISGGKIKNPYLNIGALLWDTDMTPEGIAASYKYKFDVLDGLEWNSVLGGFYTEERSSAGDSGLMGIQSNVKVNFIEKASVLFGLSYFDYGNMEGFSPLYDSSDSFGNSVDASGNYANDFNEIEVSFKFTYKLGSNDIPLSIFADFVTNTEADDNENAFLVGFSVGKAKKKNTWAFKYDYRQIESDALVGAFTDSDSGGGGTNVSGHRVSFAYQILKHWQLASTLFINEKRFDDSNSADYLRLQLDLKFKF